MNGSFRVGEFLIEPQINTISGAERNARVEPKVMQVLVCLAEHAGEVVLKEKLIQSVWSNTFVTDDVLTRAISELRKVFKDEAREPRFIQTIPRSGYRLIAPISHDGVKPIEIDLPVPVPVEIKNRTRLFWAAGILVGLLLFAVSAWYIPRLITKPGRTQPALTAKPLTTDPGYEGMASLLPDGSQVAYASGGPQSGNFDIYVKQIGGGPPLRLTSDPAADKYPAWSPDGRSIAFIRPTGGAPDPCVRRARAETGTDTS